MLRMNPAVPIRSCSKAPGVFSSNYRYPASSPELHFHRASPRDSFPVITPFVHVGTYPTRNCAHVFLGHGPYLHPFARGTTYGLSYESWIHHALPHDEVACYEVILSELFTVSYNRPNPFRLGPKSGAEPSDDYSYRRHSPWHIQSSDTTEVISPPVLNLPASVRRHPLYLLLRVRRELCFW